MNLRCIYEKFLAWLTQEPVGTPEGTDYVIGVENGEIVRFEINDLPDGGADLSDNVPHALGTAAAGTGTKASRDDHVHAMPTAADVGADAAGTATAAVAAHVGAADPHPQYTTPSEAAAVAPVQTVAGRTGNVTLAVADVSGAVDTADARLSDARTPTAHTHPSTDISDSTATGRAVLTAADAAAARTVIGVAVTSDALGNIRGGNNAQSSVTTGSSNIAIGDLAQYSITEGDYNVAIGYAAQYSITEGDYNVAIGYAAQFSITEGDFNVAIGNAAQSALNDGSALTSADKGVFIGQDTRASADGNTAETVIGAGARGNGSYTATIGAPPQTACYISGVIVPATYTVATLPLAPAAGAIAYASDGRKSGEGAGAGTGVPVYYSAGKWRVYRDDSEVLA